MKKWESVEDIINNKISSLGKGMKSGVKNLTPKKVKEKVSKVETNLKNKKKKLKDKVVNSSSKLKDNLKNSSSKALEAKNKFQTFTQNNIKKIRNTKWSKVNYLDKFLLGIEWLLLPLLSKAQSLFTSVTPKKAVGFVIVATSGSLTFIAVVKNAEKIAEKERARKGIQEEKVENATVVSKRPGYYKQNEKQLILRNVVMPIYIESTTSHRKLQMDLTIVSSNRYIKEFFFEKPYHINNALNSTVEPIIPTFPLQKEGKDIIKAKVKKEINKLIKDLKIKGEVKEIYIHSIIAG